MAGFKEWKEQKMQDPEFQKELIVALEENENYLLKVFWAAKGVAFVDRTNIAPLQKAILAYEAYLTGDENENDSSDDSDCSGPDSNGSSAASTTDCANRSA